MSFFSKIKVLAGESIVYGLSGIFSRLIGFFLLPFFARTLSTADYGAIALLQSFFFLISTISFLGLDSAVFRWYYDYEEVGERKSVFSTAITFQIVWALFLGMILWVIGVFFLDENLKGYAIERIFFLVSLNLVASILPNMFAGWCRLQHKPWSAISIGIMNSLLSFVVSFLFVIVYGYGVLGYFGGQTIALVLTSLVSLFLLKGWIKVSLFNFTLLKKMAIYGVNLVPASLATTGMLFLINFILQNKTSQSDLGLYQMGVTFALIITLITNAFSQAWGPFAFSIMKAPEHGNWYNLTFQIYVAGLTTASLALALFSPELLYYVASEKFLSSAQVAGILTFAYFIASLSTIGITGMSLVRDMKFYSPAIISGSLVTVGLMFVMVPKYGRTGAAMAFLVGQTIAPILLFYKSQKLYTIPFQFLQPVILVVVSMVLYFLTQTFFEELTIENFLWKVVILGLFAVLNIILYLPLLKQLKGYFSKKLVS